MESSNLVDQESTCVFCDIANGMDQIHEILSQDEEVVCFKDIKPAAPHHYLVIPRTHIDDCTQLRQEHTPLVVRMANMGLSALQSNGFTDMSNVSVGFHVPPFISVPHLHLHVLAPSSHMYEDTVYRGLTPESHWFLKVERLLHQLNPKDALWSPGNRARLSDALKWAQERHADRPAQQPEPPSSTDEEPSHQLDE